MSESVIQIPVERLTRVLDILLNHVPKNSDGEIEIRRDAFWSIPADSAYDVYHEPQG